MANIEIKYINIFSTLRLFLLASLTVLLFFIGENLLAQTNLTLPFFDDFSYACDRDTPLESLWEDSERVYVNDHLALDPPSIGVASFDQLDKNGELTVNNGLNFQHQAHDFLTSQTIDLSETEGSTVYLSFWYQTKGSQYDGPAGDDFFIEAIACEEGECDWETLDIIEGVTTTIFTDYNEFIYYEISITADKYLHEKFQFRFSNQNQTFKAGNEVWNIDNVLLDAYPTPALVPPLNDIAISEYENRNFNRYSVMPWDQFYGNEDLFWNDNYTIQLSNISGVDQQINYPDITIETDQGGLVYFGHFADINNQIVTGSNRLSEFEFDITADELDLPITPVNQLITTYSFIQNSDEGIDVNNVVSQKLKFGSELGYDDGTMEGHIGVNRNLAMQFNAPNATSLYGTKITLAQTHTNYGGNSYLIRVYKDDPDNSNAEGPGELIYTRNNFYPTNSFLGKEIFIPFLNEEESAIEPIPIEAGENFYINIHATHGNLDGVFIQGCGGSGCGGNLLLGLDHSQDNYEHVFLSTDANNQTWVAANTVDEYNNFPGTPMIRAVLASDINDQNFESDYAIDLTYSPVLICAGSYFSIEPTIFSLDKECRDDIIFNMGGAVEYSNTLVYRSDIQGYSPVVDIMHQAPLTPGFYTITCLVIGSCGTGYEEFEFEVVPSTSFISDQIVCNNYPEAAPTAIASNVYLSNIVTSGGADCIYGAEVSVNNDVSFIAEEEVRLLPGFWAAKESLFLGRIGESDYPCIEKNQGIVGMDTAEMDEYSNSLEKNTFSTLSDVTIYPNPTRGDVRIAYTIPDDNTDRLRITIRDMYGKDLGLSVEELFPSAGNYEQPFSLLHLPYGIYLCEILIGQERQLLKIVKTHL